MKITKMLITTRFRMRTRKFLREEEICYDSGHDDHRYQHVVADEGMPEKKILRMTLRRILPTLFYL